ncbi:DUF3558 domain-containing protein [Rhodococcus triatomae]|uniref:DUF3558 domain-containing protein n=1 Tax=Rhodococcus triatomae TaxID=300028 RepID=A0A1G8MAT4_9NOCA|nr:DUF3558 domain-containing protein [Rhodococcus triatomae]QNG18158.1 DUF3558 domain-containing protein [Rhodococcus triatomae]QNG22172.1 DUF3558 domain-containing protein [Rhodococcus triatomae]SDI64500.1 Protein of unknown function [Rhodococcus triatomae]
MTNFKTIRSFGVVMAVVAIGTSSAACGASQGEDVPEPQASLTSHPCDVFGPDALSAAGFDPSESERYDDREEPFQRRACSYYAGESHKRALVSFNGMPLADVESDERFTLVEDVEVAGHRALVHDFPGGVQCLASVEIDPGVLEVMVGYKAIGMETPEEACSFALQVAEDLAPYFPEHL